MENHFDAAVIGGGAVGLACALQIKTSMPWLSVCIIEKEADTAFGTSGRNSAVVHAGFNNPVGSLKARLCLEGSRGFEALASDLGVKYRKTGKLVVGFTDEDRKTLEQLLAQGKANGVEGLEIVEKTKIAELAPRIEGNFGLFSPDTAIFDPFEYCAALAKRNHEKGTSLFFSTEVVNIEKNKDNRWLITAERTFISDNGSFVKEPTVISAEKVINAAGLNSGRISGLAGAGNFEIRPCRGEYHILEKKAAEIITMPVYPVPNKEKNVLGIHLTPTTDGKVMFGPSAEFIEETDDYSTTSEVMKMLKEGGTALCPELKTVSTVRSFSGIRPKCSANNDDFIIEESLPGFINLIGIESPGMTASMPIGGMVAEMVIFASGATFHSSTAPLDRIESSGSSTASLDRGESSGNSTASPDPTESSGKTTKLPCRNEISGKTAPSGSKLICRCEKVTAADILEAFDEICKIGAIPTLKGLKNRTGAFMGLCQGGFCTVDTAELLEKERGFSPGLLTYDGPGSELFDTDTRLK